MNSGLKDSNGSWRIIIENTCWSKTPRTDCGEALVLPTSPWSVSCVASSTERTFHKDVICFSSQCSRAWRKHIWYCNNQCGYYQVSMDMAKAALQSGSIGEIQFQQTWLKGHSVLRTSQIYLTSGMLDCPPADAKNPRTVLTTSSTWRIFWLSECNLSRIIFFCSASNLIYNRMNRNKMPSVFCG